MFLKLKNISITKSGVNLWNLFQLVHESDEDDPRGNLQAHLIFVSILFLCFDTWNLFFFLLNINKRTTFGMQA